MKKGQRLLCSDAFISTSNDKLFYKILSVQNSVDNNMDCQWNYTKPVSYTHLDVYKRQLPHSPVLFLGQ